MKKLMLILLAGSSINIAMAATPNNESSTVVREDVGIIEAAPAGKYKNKPESTIYEQPAFVNSSSPTGGSGAEVPISPYVIIGVDLDQQGSIQGAKNGGTVPFTDNGAYVTLGFDKKVGDSWVVGGYIKQKGTFPVQQNDASDPQNGGYFPSTSSTEARVQAGYATSYGLANIVRMDFLSGAYGAPGFYFNPTLRFEEFLRYDTQYSKTFYQFSGGRARYRTDGGWDARAFIGQGFQFSERDTYELAFVQDFAQAGEVYGGGAFTVVGPDGQSFLAGVVSKQLLTNSYTHVFSNKTSINLSANWVGSTYYTGNYQSGFDVEANFRIPF